jgi:tetratricopeptide (TPR) repeat protein
MLNERTKAAEFTEKAAKIDPANIWYTQELAYMYFEQEKLEDASRCFQKLVTAEPRNIDWLYGYAEVLKRLNKKQEAIGLYDRMEEELGVIPDITLQKYDLYLSAHQDEKALNEIEKARKVFPDDIQLLGTSIDYYFQHRQVDKAREMLVQLVKADPRNGRANLALADLYMRENNKKEAYAYFKAAFQGEGLDIDTKMNVLLTFYEQQSRIEPEVFQLAEIMIDKHPEDARSYAIQGDLLLKNEEESEALSSFTEALKYDESKFPVWYQVVMLEYRLKRFEDLYRDSRACSALFPTMSNVQLLYATACVQTGRYQEAIEAAETGKDLVINDPGTEASFYAQRGDACFLLNRVSDGIASYEKALELDPKNQLNKSNYALRLALANVQPEKAMQLISVVVKEYPKQPAFSDVMGVVLFQQEKYTDAFTYFELANQLQPNDYGILEHLGDVFFKLNDVSQALEYWKKAKSLGSKNKVLDKKIQTKTYYAPVY